MAAKQRTEMYLQRMQLLSKSILYLNILQNS